MLILTSWLVANDFLLKYKSPIEEELSKYFNQKVFIANLIYIPPNFIIIQNIYIVKKEKPQIQPSYSIKSIALTLSLKDTIKKRIFAVSGIHISEPRITVLSQSKKSLPERILFMNESIKNFLDKFQYLKTGEPTKFVIKGGLLTFVKSGKSLAHMSIDKLEIQQQAYILCSGSVRLDNQKNALMDYRFEGHLDKDVFSIDNLELEMENFYSRLVGALGIDAVRLKGYSSYGRLSKYSESFEEEAEGVLSKIKKLLKYQPKPPSQMFWASAQGDINIANLDCMIKFSPQKISIEDLTCSLNNMPIDLKASYLFSEPALLNFRLSSFAFQPELQRANNPKAFDIELSVSQSKNIFSGKTRLVFARKVKNKTSREKTAAEFKNLSLEFNNYKELRFGSEEANFSYESNNNLYQIKFSDLLGAIKLADKKIQFIKLQSAFYDGSLIADGQLDLSSFPPKSSFNLLMKKVSANELKSIYKYFSSFSGKLDSQIHISGYPDLILNGNLIINNGYLEDIRFFNWLADFFDIQEFKKIYFQELSTDFAVNNNVSSLDAIKLKAERINLGGNFNLYEDGLVSGKFSLALAKDLLGASEKFKPLLRLIKQDSDHINFDFQLSGIFEAMNFKWLESDFKKGFKDLLPASMEKGLEDQIETAVESIQTN
jgi:hypothetical protein